MSLIKDVNELQLTVKAFVINVACVLPFWYMDLFIFQRSWFTFYPFYIPMVFAFCLTLVSYIPNYALFFLIFNLRDSKIPADNQIDELESKINQQKEETFNSVDTIIKKKSNLKAKVAVLALELPADNIQINTLKEQIKEVEADIEYHQLSSEKRLEFIFKEYEILKIKITKAKEQKSIITFSTVTVILIIFISLASFFAYTNKYSLKVFLITYTIFNLCFVIGMIISFFTDIKKYLKSKN